MMMMMTRVDDEESIDENNSEPDGAVKDDFRNAMNHSKTNHDDNADTKNNEIADGDNESTKVRNKRGSSAAATAPPSPRGRKEFVNKKKKKSASAIAMVGTLSSLREKFTSKLRPSSNNNHGTSNNDLEDDHDDSVTSDATSSSMRARSGWKTAVFDHLIPTGVRRPRLLSLTNPMATMKNNKKDRFSLLDDDDDGDFQDNDDYLFSMNNKKSNSDGTLNKHSSDSGMPNPPVSLGASILNGSNNNMFSNSNNLFSAMATTGTTTQAAKSKNDALPSSLFPTKADSQPAPNSTTNSDAFAALDLFGGKSSADAFQFDAPENKNGKASHLDTTENSNGSDFFNKCQDNKPQQQQSTKFNNNNKHRNMPNIVISTKMITKNQSGNARTNAKQPTTATLRRKRTTTTTTAGGGIQKLKPSVLDRHPRQRAHHHSAVAPAAAKNEENDKNEEENLPPANADFPVPTTIVCDPSLNSKNGKMVGEIPGRGLPRMVSDVTTEMIAGANSDGKLVLEDGEEAEDNENYDDNYGPNEDENNNDTGINSGKKGPLHRRPRQQGEDQEPNVDGSTRKDVSQGGSNDDGVMIELDEDCGEMPGGLSRRVSELTDTDFGGNSSSNANDKKKMNPRSNSFKRSSSGRGTSRNARETIQSTEIVAFDPLGAIEEDENARDQGNSIQFGETSFGQEVEPQDDEDDDQDDFIEDEVEDDHGSQSGMVTPSEKEGTGPNDVSQSNQDDDDDDSDVVIELDEKCGEIPGRLQRRVSELTDTGDFSSSSSMSGNKKGEKHTTNDRQQQSDDEDDEAEVNENDVSGSESDSESDDDEDEHGDEEDIDEDDDYEDENDGQRMSNEGPLHQGQTEESVRQQEVSNSNDDEGPEIEVDEERGEVPGGLHRRVSELTDTEYLGNNNSSRCIMKRGSGSTRKMSARTMTETPGTEFDQLGAIEEHRFSGSREQKHRVNQDGVDIGRQDQDGGKETAFPGVGPPVSVIVADEKHGEVRGVQRHVSDMTELDFFNKKANATTTATASGEDPLGAVREVGQKEEESTVDTKSEKDEQEKSEPPPDKTPTEENENGEKIADRNESDVNTSKNNDNDNNNDKINNKEEPTTDNDKKDATKKLSEEELVVFRSRIEDILMELNGLGLLSKSNNNKNNITTAGNPDNTTNAADNNANAAKEGEEKEGKGEDGAFPVPHLIVADEERGEIPGKPTLRRQVSDVTMVEFASSQHEQQQRQRRQASFSASQPQVQQNSSMIIDSFDPFAD